MTAAGIEILDYSQIRLRLNRKYQISNTEPKIKPPEGGYSHLAWGSAG